MSSTEQDFHKPIQISKEQPPIFCWSRSNLDLNDIKILGNTRI
jgi:hypothetical protein